MTTMQTVITTGVFLLMVATMLYVLFAPTGSAATRTKVTVQPEPQKMSVMLREAATDVAAKIAVAAQMPPDVDAFAWVEPEVEYVPATWVDTLRIPEGYVLMRGYKDRVERSLVLTKSTLARKHGGRVNLQPFEGFYTQGSPIVRDATLESIKALLDGGVLLHKAKAPSPAPAVRQEKEVAPAKVEPEVFAEDKTPKRSKVFNTWRGILKEHGVGERSISKSGQDDAEADAAPESVKQYRLVLELEHGEIESVWGQDLHRALKDSGAAKGDLIEVLQTGKKTLDNGRKMKLFSIKKVA